MSETFSYGPTPTHPDPGELWHDGCGQQVMVDEGYVCGCGQQWKDAPDGSGPVPIINRTAKTDAAIDVVARHFVRAAMERFAENAWELYPEIGQGTFDEIERRAMAIVGPWPDNEVYSAAYDHLDHLAQEWARQHPGESD